MFAKVIFFAVLALIACVSAKPYFPVAAVATPALAAYSAPLTAAAYTSPYAYTAAYTAGYPYAATTYPYAAPVAAAYTVL